MNKIKTMKYKYHNRGQGALMLQERLGRQQENYLNSSTYNQSVGFDGDYNMKPGHRAIKSYDIDQSNLINTPTDLPNQETHDNTTLNYTQNESRRFSNISSTIEQRTQKTSHKMKD